jgi:diguanylate cyclase (GGDEF)-like protein/PAS domain S-box-containing protein
MSFSAAFLGSTRIPAEHAHAIAAARYEQFQKLAPLAALYSLLNAVVLTIAFWHAPVMPVVLLWSSVSAVIAILGVRASRRFFAGNGAKTAPPAFRIVRSTVITGSVWGAIITALVAYSNESHVVLLGVMTAGVICVGALLHSGYPAASLGFSLCVGAGAMAGLYLGDSPRALEAGVLLAGYVIALQRFAVVSSDNFVRRHLDAAELSESRQTIGLLLHDFEAHSSDWLWSTDANNRLTFVSNRFSEAAGLPPETLEGVNLLALFAPACAARLERIIAERRPFRDQAFEFAVGGRRSWWQISGRPSADGGYRGVSSDITSSRDAEARIAYFTQFDSLTDLPNRATLVKRLEQAVDARESFALMHIDLDNFRAINDTLGHPVGDAFLKVVAERLRDSVGPDIFLARTGGDDFAIVHPGPSREDAGDIADLVVDALLAPVYLNGREILAGGSIGIAMSPEDGGGPAALMKNAELALYRAKDEGRACTRFFEAGMDEEARERAEMETDLRLALATDAMDVYFQPLVKPRTREISGYETLLRWNRPGHGLVSPSVFIACAEETGIIVPLGEWVIRNAIAEAATWRDDLPVAINLSPTQMKNPSLISTVVGAIAKSQLDPSRVEIEITESVLMQETDHTLRTLHALKDLGVKIALDDFGTGYSSLSYLRAFPFDKIKIDQSFVRDIEASGENQAIVRSVITLARDLGMRITAEGVENEQQAAILAALGCDDLQGYLFSRPAPARDIAKRDSMDRPGAKVLPMRARRAS